VEFERAAGLQALGEQGGGAGLGRVGGDEGAEPDGVGAAPAPGGVPTPTSSCPKTAFSAAANRMSQASASSLPTPRARPRILAMVTTGSSLSLCHSMPSDASPGPPALAASAVYSATLVRSTCGMKYSGSALSSTTALVLSPDSGVPSRLTRSRTSSGPIRFIGGASITTLSTPSPSGATRSVRYTWVIAASLVRQG